MPRLILGPIIGNLSQSGVYLWGRADEDGFLYAWIGKQPDLSDAILAGVSLRLSSENGFAGVAPVSDLTPDTRYFYSLSLTERLPEPGEYPSFQTAPLPGTLAPFNFVFGSCFRPKNMQAGKIISVMDEHVVKDDLRFMILLGDQIYADDCKYNSLGRVAFSVDDYRLVYSHVWSHPGLRRLFRKLPAYMILDDHEVDDDWRWVDRNRTKIYIPWWDRLSRIVRGCLPEEVSMKPQRVRNALQVYWEHQGMHAPPFELTMERTPGGQYALNPSGVGALAYTFTFGAAAFFVMDTRTMRTRSIWPFNQQTASMLGDAQWQALESWLLAVKDTYPLKFVVSSSALLFNLWLDIPRDRWSGYMAERRRFLKLIAEMEIQGVHLITGDLHSSHAVHAELSTPGGRELDLWEFCSSPLDQDGNWWAKYVYRTINEPPLNQQACKFIVEDNNFGLVRVKYEQDGRPSVQYEVYTENDRLVASAISEG